jgi:predicted transcriptional regulator
VTEALASAAAAPTELVLSIRTPHLRRIISGDKQHEFRRRRVSARAGDVVLVYEVAPVAAVTASFTVAEVVHGAVDDLLALERDEAARAHLAEYLSGCRCATALRVADARRLDRPLPLSAVGLARAPQSWAFARPPL